MTEHVTRVATLLCHRDVEMAVGNFRSLARHSKEAVRLVVHDDGSLTPDDISALTDASAGFEVERIVSREEADAATAAILARRPLLSALRTRQAYGLKLIDVPLFADDTVHYIDSDVRFLRPFTSLFTLDTQTNSIFTEDTMNAYAMRPWHLLHPQINLPQRVNSGIFSLRRDVADFDAMEWLLGRRYPVFDTLPWFEQTCWAWLAWRRGGAFMWDSRAAQVVTASTDLTNPHLIAAHFVSSNRSRIDEVPQARTLGEDAVEVGRSPMRRLGPLGYSAETVRRGISNRRPDSLRPTAQE